MLVVGGNDKLSNTLNLEGRSAARALAQDILEGEVLGPEQVLGNSTVPARHRKDGSPSILVRNNEEGGVAGRDIQGES